MKKVLTNIWFWIIVILLVICCLLKWYLNESAKNLVTEEKIVYLASPEYLKSYKDECIAEGGVFCAQRADTKAYTGANPYSDALDTTGYLLRCTKSKVTSQEPECLTVP